MKKKITIIILFLTILLITNCVVSSDYLIEESTNNNSIEPIFSQTLGIDLAIPEQNQYYTANGIRFNWATNDITTHLVYILDDPVIVEKKEQNDFTYSSIKNKENIMAMWSSTMGESNGNSTGFLKADVFKVVSNGVVTDNNFTFTTGQYFVVVIGYDRNGELKYSSQEKRFYIY